MGENTERVKAENGAAWRRWITLLLLLGAAAVVAVAMLGGWDRFIHKAQVAADVGPQSDTTHPSDIVRNPQVVADETVVIGAGGHKMWQFTLPSARPVKVEIKGLRDTAKGFSVNCIPPSQWDNLSSGREFRALNAFTASGAVSSLNETHRMPAGTYAIAISNTQNFMFSIEVKVTITVDPS